MSTKNNYIRNNIPDPVMETRFTVLQRVKFELGNKQYYSDEEYSLIIYENQTGIHPDLTHALQALATHVKQIAGLPAKQALNVSGYYRQNAGNAQLLTIYAWFGDGNGDNRHSADLATRLYIGRDEYAETEQLLTDLSRCEREAIAYIVKGKTFGNDIAVAIEESDMWMFPKPVAEC